MKARVRSKWQQWLRTAIVNETVLTTMKQAGVSTGWSTSSVFPSAYYYEEKGITYQEKAFYVEIFFMPYPVMKHLAEDLRSAFDQIQVLLFSYDTGEPEFIPP